LYISLSRNKIGLSYARLNEPISAPTKVIFDSAYQTCLTVVGLFQPSNVRLRCW